MTETPTECPHPTCPGKGGRNGMTVNNRFRFRFLQSSRTNGDSNGVPMFRLAIVYAPLWSSNALRKPAQHHPSHLLVLRTNIQITQQLPELLPGTEWFR